MSAERTSDDAGERDAEWIARVRAEESIQHELDEIENEALERESYCATCGVYLAGGMIERSAADPTLCVECEPE